MGLGYRSDGVSIERLMALDADKPAGSFSYKGYLVEQDENGVFVIRKNGTVRATATSREAVRAKIDWLEKSTSDAQPFKKGESVEKKGSGKIGDVIESDSDYTLVEWRDGSESRVATSSLARFTGSWGHGTKPY